MEDRDDRASLDQATFFLAVDGLPVALVRASGRPWRIGWAAALIGVAARLRDDRGGVLGLVTAAARRPGGGIDVNSPLCVVS
ncbi:hypothetical protein BJY16_005843 [Actinoplanes octamycinicus]|uniref:Uncharacterized protein n=1 Tax=Actinoplanes octamycinicus TaxID=135948 RepID=A0A7W7M9V3_9ACTN|nr:hypothetical protein [Actinoplanes octamycinicus]MBB4742384.1 hypothetical protein [Actinoplanes octamycinicus]GIE62367.1 hypothetical protein Aoc01nite_77690 [Actinoplanes octamycinicus]